MSTGDRMTPKERFMAALSGQEMDRLIVAPLILNWASRTTGIKVGEFNRSGEKMATAQIECYRKYGHDAVFIFTTTNTLGEAMGSKLFFPEDDAPQLETPLIQTRDDIKKLKPLDPEKDGRLPVYLEAAKRCVDAIGDEVFVLPVVEAPLTTAACLRGTDVLVKEFYTDPELVHTLMRACTDAAKAAIDAFAKIGTIPIIVEPVGTGTMISDKHFRAFVLPYLQEIFAHIGSYKMPGALHICGKTKRIIKSMSESGAMILSIDDIDLADAKELVGDKVCLLGNVSPADGLFKGTPELIREMVRDCVAKAYDSPGGYIISSGCEVPIKTPHENMVAFLEAGREFGRLPIDVSKLKRDPSVHIHRSSETVCSH